MRIAILTAGGAGMFCGSCMHDNTLARALIAAGHDAALVPCYTPLTLDEESRAQPRVFLGGVNLYLEHAVPGWGRVPRFARRWLDRPAVLAMLSRLSSSTDAKQLGELTVELLRGEHGPMATELPPLVDYLVDDLRPDAVLFSNALMAGVLPSLRRRFHGPIACLLQGDDVFLDGLPDKDREQAISLMAELGEQFDRFLTHTTFYADYMAEYLRLPRDKFARVPLGIDASPFGPSPLDGGRTVGYFARLAPEKGLHHLVDAFLHAREEHPDLRLRIGGFQHAKDRAYAQTLFRRLDAAGVDWEYLGAPGTVGEKAELLRTFTVFSVPTEFLEPKGLPVLEAMASGVPVVQPAHGAFPELIHATGGGRLVPPKDSRALADAITALITDPAEREELGRRGRAAVLSQFDEKTMAAETAAAITSSVDV